VQYIYLPMSMKRIGVRITRRTTLEPFDPLDAHVMMHSLSSQQLDGKPYLHLCQPYLNMGKGS
jgi:hypothetical protein